MREGNYQAANASGATLLSYFSFRGYCESAPSLWVAGNSSSVPLSSPEKWGGLASEKTSGCKNVLSKSMVSSQEENIEHGHPCSEQRIPTSAETRQGLPHQHGRMQLKKQIHTLRIATLNIGSMTGKAREVTDFMERRKINILCVQESRWKGNEVYKLGGGYEMMHSRADERGRNGVGVVLDPQTKEKLEEVARKSSRIMRIKLVYGQEAIHVISAYAPQVRCHKAEKAKFWREMDEVQMETPLEERCVVGGDFNGHIGQNNDGVRRIHGGKGMGERNTDGEKALDFAVAFDMAILNTFFTKNSYRTYRSGNRESQIDFLLYRRDNIKEVEDCKVLQGERVGPQHSPVVAKLVVKTRRTRVERGEPRIKWWKLKDEVVRQKFKSKTLQRIEKSEDVSQWWKWNSEVIRSTAEEVLGKSSGKKSRNGREYWWWSPNCKEKIEKKKELKKAYDRERTEEGTAMLKDINKEAKRAVAQARAAALQDMYEDLETKEGQKGIFKLAKERNKSTKDLKPIRQIKDKNGRVLTDPVIIRRRWRDYYEELLNHENPRLRRGEGVGMEGEIEPISEVEVREALKKMKNGKAVGPDQIPAEVWKSLGEEGIRLLTEFLNMVMIKEIIPNEWRESLLVPIFKVKGDIQSCNNYRAVKLTSHTMKLLERVLDKRLREETEVCSEQFGFMKGRGTMDAVFALRQVMESYRDKQRELYMSFIDLENAYDWVPRSEVWRSMRSKGVKEKYVKVVQDMYREVTTRVKSTVGTTEPFPVRVGLHQGSVLSPYLFNLLMDVLVEEVTKEAPWSMLFADDIVLVSESREELQERLELWRGLLEDYGLKVSRQKTKYLECNMAQGGDLFMQDYKLQKVDAFKYLGSYIAKDGGLEREIDHRIQAAWNNWKRTSGVLCDKKISARVKGKVYKTVVRPAFLYGAETWPLKKLQERKLDVAEMRMLRWMCGVTIQKDRIRDTVKVVEVSAKTQEKRLQWFGHVKRRDEDYVGVRVMQMDVQGRRRQGRPKLRWEARLKEDLRERQLVEEQVRDRNQWKRLVKRYDPI